MSITIEGLFDDSCPSFPFCVLPFLGLSVPVPARHGLLPSLATTLILHACPFASFSYLSGPWGRTLGARFKVSALEQASQVQRFQKDLWKVRYKEITSR